MPCAYKARGILALWARLLATESDFGYPQKGSVMKITYDKETDALYIHLIEGEHQCKTVRLTEEIALDFARGEQLIGIEILDAREILGKGNLPKVVVENLPFQAAA